MLVKPGGVGDLQKGERYAFRVLFVERYLNACRYANMDYIFWSALVNERVDNVMVTYDIGCQWKVHLNKRLEQVPVF